jgi:uncharacterized membrane protein
MFIAELMARAGARPPRHLPRTKDPAVAGVIEENIRVIAELREAGRRAKSPHARMADWIARLSGHVGFLYLHAAWFSAWILVNVGTHPLVGFDPYPFGLLTMVVSLEAIFLSTIVLISQNMLGAAADRRADLDLQIDLLSEHEITRVLVLVDRIAQKLGIEEGFDPALPQLERATVPGKVMEEIQAREEDARE